MLAAVSSSTLAHAALNVAHARSAVREARRLEYEALLTSMAAQRAIASAQLAAGGRLDILL